MLKELYPFRRKNRDIDILCQVTGCILSIHEFYTNNCKLFDYGQLVSSTTHYSISHIDLT